ncbi:MAG: hypothetical protein JWO83_4767 [Caulobacteraceae bacterium]|nr:hypothetical protein [Caulobacteraceae bacterium]
MSSHGARGPAAGIVLLGYLASLIADYPGHFPPDALWQLAQGRSGRYNTWHPPVMAWLLGLADRVHPGAWLFVVLNGALFYGALFAFVALERRPRLFCLPLLVLWMISPIVLVYQGVVLKDVLFANAALAGFAALAWAGRLWARPLSRCLLLVAALLLFTLAALTRQNGFVVALFAALALAAIAATRPGPTRRKVFRAALWAGSGLALVAVGDVLASAALLARADGRPENANHLKVLQVYDLAGATRLDPSLPLAILHTRQPALERFLRDQAAPHYRPAGADNLFALPGGEAMMIPPGPVLGEQWASLVRDHPWLYLETRARVWLTTLRTPASAACPMIITGVDGGDPAVLVRAGLRARDDAKDEWDEDYASRFLGGPLYSHVCYGVLLLVALAWLVARWRRGDCGPEAIVTAAMGLAALAFAGSFFVVSIDCDYRFLYFLDVAAIAMLSRLAAAPPRGPVSG